MVHASTLLGSLVGDEVFDSVVGVIALGRAENYSAI